MHDPRRLIYAWFCLKSRRFGASSRVPESKYTAKVRSCGGKMPTDGYKWRKYGQKSIKNNPHPRCSDRSIHASSYLATDFNSSSELSFDHCSFAIHAYMDHAPGIG